MDFMPKAFFSLLDKKNTDYSGEFKKFKSAIKQNKGDHGLQAQFVKFCLLNHFTRREITEDHLTEALDLYEVVAKTDVFDPQIHYLAGRYYQDKDISKASRIYLEGIKRFNQHVGKNPGLKSDHVDLVYAIALNLLTLRSGHIDPELEKFFKTIRKSYPLHVKQVELENEMGKPAPSQTRIKQLTHEIQQLKAAAEKEKPKPGLRVEAP